MLTQEDKDCLFNMLHSRKEWLLLYASGESFALQSNEIELEFTRGKLYFGFPDNKGFQTWRVEKIARKDGKLSLDLTKNFGKDSAKIKLVPRISSNELAEIGELARIEKAQKIANLFAANGKIIRAELNKENGRIAEIVLEDKRGKRTAISADVTNKIAPEILLSSAILRLRKLQNLKRNPIEKITIAVEKKQVGSLQKLHSVLRESWQKRVLLKEFSLNKETSQNEQIKEVKVLTLNDLRREKPKPIKPIQDFTLSETSQKIIEIAPADIDAVFSQNGETLRFRGLPFARVRKIADVEKVWFGIESKRQILSDKNFAEFVKLIDELKIYRTENSPNKRHDFYRLAPEAWLESIIRRNIKLLDANLILSPLHHQFRAEREKIDLLALRKDGRLVIIELKTAADREMIFQAADYWRKIEIARRKGILHKAKIFGDLEISDKPTLIYLVAPTLLFHRDFEFSASTINENIEKFRFEINEDWRRKTKVLSRFSA